MNQIDEHLLLLLRRGLFGSMEDLPADADWAALYREARLHAVIPLTFSALRDDERAQMPQEVLSAWKQDTLRVIYQNQRLLQEQKAVLAALKRAQIPCAVLKGSSVAIHYPDPILRSMGDIDLLVSPSQQMAAVAVLQGIGYGEVHGEASPCHLEVKRGSFIVEVHREPNGLYICEDEVLKDTMRRYFEAQLVERDIVDGIPMLPGAAQALVLLLHKLGHFLNSGLGLRQLCDWAVFVSQNMNDTLWTELSPLLYQFGLLHFTQIITNACIDYLGAPREALPAEMQSDGSYHLEVLEEIMKTGNFNSKGRMVPGQALFTNSYSANRVASFWRILVTSCKRHFPPCRKYPILLPVSLIVFGIRYGFLCLIGKRHILHMPKAFSASGEKQKLFRKLRPFISQTQGDSEHEA